MTSGAKAQSLSCPTAQLKLRPFKAKVGPRSLSAGAGGRWSRSRLLRQCSPHHIARLTAP